MVFQLQLQLQLLNLFLLQLQLQLTVGYFSVILSFQLQLQLIEITLLEGMSFNYIKVASAQIWKHFRFLIELFRIGIVYHSMLYQVTLLIHLKIDWISITCTVKSHRLSFPCRSSSLLGDFTLNYIKLR